jgi:hypothetical protein
MAKQKFHRGDLVRLLNPVEWLGQRKDDLVMIEGSYKDLYGGRGNNNSYSIIHPKCGSMAWVEHYDLELVKRGHWKELIKGK